jgi:hypothetical protein
MTAYVTVSDYETYVGQTLETNERSLVTNSYIPEATELIENEVGYPFNADADDKRLLDADINTDGFNKLFFETFLAAEPTSVKLDGTLIASANYVMLGEPDGPYYGLELLASSGLSWKNYGDDPEDAVEVDGKWGYSQTPPELIKKVIYSYIQQSLKNRSGTAVDVDLQTLQSFRILRGYPSFRPFSNV